MFRTSANTDVGARRGLWRSRWAAIGAAVAVSLGAGGFFVAQAAPGPSESTIVTVTPERILDTRDPNNVGLGGPFVSAVSQKLQVTGSIPTATGTKTVVPTGATGVLLNVTPVSPTADGFISIRPGDATGAATTSSLNFTAGGVLPNAVQVAVPTSGANAGKIDITYDAYGQAGPTTDLLIDVVGYMTSAGLQELVADVATKANAADVTSALATKANAADVYTKAQTDAKFATSGSMTLGAASFTADLAPADWTNGCVRNPGGDFEVRAAVQLPVGVTITSITGNTIDNNAANHTFTLRRLAQGSITTIATVTSSGASGSNTNRSANLATPELVQSGEYFFVEFDAPDGTSNHQICGASIQYTIPIGQSILLEEPATGDATGIQPGQE